MPELITLRGIELCEVGTWACSTGPASFTPNDLANAVSALDCPAVRAPIIKLGHVDPRFDGEPAIGRVTNMAVSANGMTLIGDYEGLPSWLGEVMASAFPGRSIEAYWAYRCAVGHTHPFVITAVALLGVTAPAIATLADIEALYGTDAIAASTRTLGEPSLIFLPPKEAPLSLKVSAAAIRAHTTETSTADWKASTMAEHAPVDAQALRAAHAWVDPSKPADQKSSYKFLHHFIDSDGTVGAASLTGATNAIAALNGARGMEMPDDERTKVYAHLAKHIRDGGATPPELGTIASGLVHAQASVDDVRRAYYATAGPMARQFWVREIYIDPAQLIVDDGDDNLFRVGYTVASDGSVSFGEPVPVVLTFVDGSESVSAAASYPDAGASRPVPSAPPSPRPTGQKGVPMPLPAQVLAALGVPEDADDETILAKAKTLAAAAQAKANPKALPEGMTVIDETTLDQLRASAAAGVAAAERQRTDDRDRYIEGAVKAGKIPPARRAYWQDYYDRDESGAREFLDRVAAGSVVPLAEIGHAGDGGDVGGDVEEELRKLGELGLMAGALKKGA